MVQVAAQSRVESQEESDSSVDETPTGGGQALCHKRVGAVGWGGE